MANTKISALTSATTPLDGTEVLPIVQSNTTKKVANNDLRPKQIQSNATSGVMQIAGPAAAATRVMTIPDANFTVARTDASQSFTNEQGIGISSSNITNTQNKTQQILYENTNGGYSLATGYSSSFYSYANGGTTGNVAYLSNGGSYLQIAAGLVGIVGSTFTIGSNTYTITTSSPEGYIYITPSASGEAATGTLTNLKYATERVRINSSGDFTLKSGNYVPATAAKGINFTANTPAAGMTSQLLNWYEEGTWTPTDTSGASLSFTNAFGYYTRNGNIVTLFGRVTFPATASGLGVAIGGLPFTVANNNQPGGGCIRITDSGRNDTVVASANTTTITFYSTSLVNATNANYSGKRVDWVVTYMV
jgi:hypothetical protein